MLDRYVYGAVNRISPEAPVPVLSVEREVAMGLLIVSACGVVMGLLAWACTRRAERMGIGTVLALYSVAVVFFGPPVARFVDRHADKRLFIVLAGVACVALAR